MKSTLNLRAKQQQCLRFCLFAVAVGLAVLHLILTLRVLSGTDRLAMEVLCWGAVLHLLWRDRDIFHLKSSMSSSFIGFFTIGFVLLKSAYLFWFESSFLKLFPLTVALGLALLASGVKGLKQYWRELIILLLLCLPGGIFGRVVEQYIPISELTAQFTAFSLWYMGFDPVRQGVNVILPQGAVEVLYPCTGIGAMLLLFKLSVVFALVFPTNRKQKILLAIASIVIGFITGGTRVLVMALVVSNQEAFDYWHGTEGGSIFSTVAIFIFGLFCQFLLQQGATKSGSIKKYESL